MEDGNKISEKLDELVGLLKTLVIFEALRADVSGGRVRNMLGVDMNLVTKVSKALKSTKKGRN